MTASNLALFPQHAVHLSAVATAALTDLDDAPGAELVELALPAAVESDGALLVRLWAIPRATCAATVLYVFLSTDNGITRRLIGSALASADTVSTSDAPVAVTLPVAGVTLSESAPLYLPPGSGSAKTRLYVGASIALSAGWVFSAQALLLAKAGAA